MDWYWIAAILMALGMTAVGFSHRLFQFSGPERQPFAIIGPLILVVIVVLLIDTSTEWIHSTPTEFFAFFGLLVLLALQRRDVRHRKEAGAVLLTLGRSTAAENFSILIPIIYLLWDLIEHLLRILASPTGHLLDLSFKFVLLLNFFFLAIVVTRKRAICERGIFTGGSLLRWESIERYAWGKETPKGTMLIIRRIRRLPLLRYSELPVQGEQLSAIKSLLKQYLQKDPSAFI